MATPPIRNISGERDSKGGVDRVHLTSPLCAVGGYIQGLPSRPVRPNRTSGLAGYRSEPIKFKFEFKLPSSTGSYRYTSRFDQYTGRFGW